MRCPAGCTCLAAARIFSLTPLGSSTIKLPNPASSLHLLGAAVQQFNTHEQTVASQGMLGVTWGSTPPNLAHSWPS